MPLHLLRGEKIQITNYRDVSIRDISVLFILDLILTLLEICYKIYVMRDKYAGTLFQKRNRNNAMKILITTDLYTVKTNGVVTSVRNLYDELLADGHDVRILTLSGSNKSRREGHVYYIRSVSLDAVYPDVRMPTSYRHKLIKELIIWKPDVIHSQCEFFTFQYASRISKCTGAPIVHTYHTLYEQYFTYLVPMKSLSKRAVSMFSKTRLKKVKRVIAPTPKVAGVLRDYGLSNPISVIPSGINLERFKNRISPEERLARRRSLGISDNQTVMLNLGRLGTEKNVDELIRLFAKAAKDRDDIVFLIVGDGPAREQLGLLSAELSIQNKVIFTGMVDPSQVQYYYQLSDFFASASTSETQGLTYIEAAANGLPLLCRADPCLQDVLIGGVNGYTYSSEAEFLNHFYNICNNPKWRCVAGEHSRSIAMSYDKHTFGDSVEALYDAVVK